MHGNATERKPFVVDQADLIPGVTLADAKYIQALENTRRDLLLDVSALQDRIAEIDNKLSRLRGRF